MEDYLRLQSAALKIQSLWRGYSTRKALKNVYSWYDDVMFAIDRDNTMSTPCNVTSRKMKSYQFVLSRPRITNTFNKPKHDLSKTLTSEVAEVCSEKYEDTFMTLSSENKSSIDTSCEDVDTASELLETKRNVAMELVWIQQAIESRRNYLQIKQQLTK